MQDQIPEEEWQGFWTSLTEKKRNELVGKLSTLKAESDKIGEMDGTNCTVFNHIALQKRELLRQLSLRDEATLTTRSESLGSSRGNAAADALAYWKPEDFEQVVSNPE